MNHIVPTETITRNLRLEDIHQTVTDCDAIGSVRKLSVLVIEDSQPDFELVKRTLRLMEVFDAEVHHAYDIVSARDILEAVKIDLAIVDYCLGADSGVRAIKEAGGRGGDFPIIMVSGMPAPEIQQIALNAGALNHINKHSPSPLLMDNTIRSALHTHVLEGRLKMWKQKPCCCPMVRPRWFLVWVSSTP